MELPTGPASGRMAEYDEETMPTQSNALLPPASLSVVNKQTDQTPNNLSTSSQSRPRPADSEKLPASLFSDIEPHSLGHLGILDLADELLMNIFGHATDSADIRNIRLTCRRFCSTSSHLLLDCLDVCLTAASLARAQEISCHPTISKGIRVLHISLRCNRRLPSFLGYLSSATKYLLKNLSRVDWDPQNVFENGNFTSLAEVQAILGERERLFRSWSQYSVEQRCSTHQQSLDVEVLQRGYEKYQMAYEWQRRAVKDRTFAQAIAAAVGRMSRATRLLFTNRFRYRERSPGFHANMWRHHTSASDILDDRMMLSIGVSLGPEVITPTELAVQVPLAIHSAGCSTIEIGIDFSTLSGLCPRSTWIRNRAQVPDLKAAAESLKAFTFKSCPIGSSPSEEISTSVSTYLRVVLGAGAGNIQALTLFPGFSYSSLDLDRPYKGHIGPLLASRPWPHLRDISLADFPFHLNDLKRFIEGLQPGAFLNLRLIHLRSGTWAEGLDLLRSKANPESWVCYLTGAECESISSDQIKRIFDGMQASWASQYIRGVSICNPFLVTQDETTDEETNTDSI